MATPSALALDLTTDRARAIAKTNIGQITVRDLLDLSALEMARIDRLRPQIATLAEKLGDATITDDEAAQLTGLLVEFVGIVTLMPEDARPRIGELGQAVLSRIRSTFYDLWAESLMRLDGPSEASPSDGEKPAPASNDSLAATP